jgi:hypothetical protein
MHVARGGGSSRRTENSDINAMHAVHTRPKPGQRVQCRRQSISPTVLITIHERIILLTLDRECISSLYPDAPYTPAYPQAPFVSRLKSSTPLNADVGNA